ncbi:MAG: hypothetical protein RIG27_32555 [Coleofasciculus sp. F4-SAH-05]
MKPALYRRSAQRRENVTRVYTEQFTIAIAPEVEKTASTTSRQGITDFYIDVPDRGLVRLS